MTCPGRNHLAFLITVSLAGMLVVTPVRAANCANDTTGRVPLTDLGTGLYRGFPGGLYGSGDNARPAGHDAAGIAIANAIVPLDTLGQPDLNGRIVLISIGMSNATQEFSTFVPIAGSDPLKSPKVDVIDCAQGGQSADRTNTPTAAYWDFIRARLSSRGSSSAQVQAVWIKQANAGPSGGFPAATITLQNNLGAIVRIIHDQFPNVRLAYFTSRIYAGYATTALNPEPYAYESGFAVKWLIDSQIAGEDSLNWDPDSGPVEAPWLSWGPYMWADGTYPRDDGLTWACNEFATDGTHPGPPARTKVANSLLAFFQQDVTTEPWYVNHDVLSAPLLSGESFALSVAPNPTRSELTVTFSAGAGESWRAEVVDLAGRRVSDPWHGVGSGSKHTLRWNAFDDGASPRPGLYWVRLTSGGRQASRRIALVP